MTKYAEAKAKRGKDEHRRHKKLSLKQQKFIYKYLELKGNATQAALAVYENNSINSAKVQGYSLLQNPLVQEGIQKLLKESGLNLDLLNLWSAQAIEHNLSSGKPSMAAGINHLQFLYKLHNVLPASKKVSAHLSVKATATPEDGKSMIKNAEELASNMQKLISDFKK